MEKVLSNYYLTESIEKNGTIWFIERGAPNSGDVVFETKYKSIAFAIYELLNI